MVPPNLSFQPTLMAGKVGDDFHTVDRRGRLSFFARG